MNFDIIIIGSGPGGYVAAIRASQLGLKTAIVEKESLGGICLNWGCIPTKALLKSAQVFEYIQHAQDFGISVNDYTLNFTDVIKRSRDTANNMSKGINFLMKKNKITVINGFAQLESNKSVKVLDSNQKETKYSAKHIIISTGARSRELPNLKQNGKNIIGYRDALSLNKLPKSMIIVGSGAIGVEFAYFYNAMGSKVTIVEYLPQIVPNEDNDISKELAKNLKKKGIEILTESTVTNIEEKTNNSTVTVETKSGKKIIDAEIILSAVGITPNIENIGLESLKIATNNFPTTAAGTKFFVLPDLIVTAPTAKPIAVINPSISP